MESATTPAPQAESLRAQVRRAVIWRSGTQILGQMIAWSSTFLVLRLLDPADYGLFAMGGVVLVLLNMLNGYGVASALIRQPDVTLADQRRLFGLLILLNVALALAQLALSPLAAAYYGQPKVAALLQAQTVLYLFTPFIAYPQAMLARAMDFRAQAAVNLASSVAGALAALGGALAGWGVWTLVAAPIALFATRAVGMTMALGGVVRPSFDLRGAGALVRFGGLLAAGQGFWFLQSQADIFLAGRAFDPHLLGLYTTALFLTQIFVSKFVPPLNEVAFSAYARLHHRDGAIAEAFLKAVRLVMVPAFPFYLGLVVVADPLVEAMLGAKWSDAAPIVRLLAVAMPVMTLNVLFAPATDAAGRPEIGARNSATGAVLLPLAFLAGVHWGPLGLAAAWVIAYPLYLVASCRRTLPVLGVTPRALAGAVLPPFAAALAMAALVFAAARALPPLPSVATLAVLASLGAGTYAAALLLVARAHAAELLDAIRRRG